MMMMKLLPQYEIYTEYLTIPASTELIPWQQVYEYLIPICNIISMITQQEMDRIMDNTLILKESG